MDREKNSIELAANFLIEERKDRRKYIAIPDRFAPRNSSEAYQIQSLYLSKLSKEWGSIKGYKVALTTDTMRKLVGLSDPISGGILANSIYTSPSIVDSNDYLNLGIECEIAMRLGRDLVHTNAPFNLQDIYDVISAIYPAFELVDDRNADYSKFPESPLSIVADNACNRGLVLGTEVPNWKVVDLASIYGTYFVNDKFNDAGRGSDVMGNPIHAIMWLANHLASMGIDLKRDQLVATGNIVVTKLVEKNDIVKFILDPIGEVCLEVI